ncbi:MAG: LamG domain-containing protein [Planctomycetota bacterium]|nr:LamG domain-containing protein [Planctomycetota bacterium]
MCSRLALLTALCSVTALAALDEPVAWDGAALPTVPNPVAADALTVDGTIDIRWRPRDFVFEPGDAPRYIDYAQGNDAADGTSPATAWKHHPWDAQATGLAAASAGIHTYVFKRGVIYRGQLRPDESGQAGQPIRLTSDPAWGEGAATISGAHAVIGPWQLTSDDELSALGFPESVRGRVHHVDLPGDFVPFAAWSLAADGTRTRLPIAREPDWETTDTVKRFAQWWRWEKVDRGFPKCMAFAPKVLAGYSKAALEGATVWTDMPNQGGDFSITGPMPTRVRNFDPATGRIQLQALVPRRQPEPRSPFFLENSPAFLDQAGEYWFAEDGPHPRRFYLYLPNGANPGATTIEVAQHLAIIDIENHDHIAISGLELTGGNSVDPDLFVETGGWKLPIPARWMAAVRLAGDVDDIELSHLNVHDTAGLGVVNHVLSDDDVVSDIVIRDSRFVNIDNAAIELYRGSKWRVALPMARLHSFSVVRNFIHGVGLRNTSHRDEGINVEGGELGEIAGNVVSHTGSKGINSYAGRLGGNAAAKPVVVPLTRILIHHNKATDTLLHATDFGGIESWGTGSTYMYGNLCYDAWGWVAHADRFRKNVAYYFDHNYKGYLFNNVGWGATDSGQVLSIFHKRVRGALNIAFNNTSWNARKHYQKESGEGSGTQEIGNLAVDGEAFISFWSIDQAREMGWANNVYAGTYQNLFDRWRGDKFTTVDALQAHLELLSSAVGKQIGWISDANPVRDAAAGDFRLSDDSAAIDRGARVFVPWALYGTVGEWNFYRNDRDPGTAMSYDMFPQEFSTSMKDYSKRVPDYSLRGSSIAAEHYVAGPLESWTKGALSFDGSREMRVSNATLLADIAYQAGKEKRTFPGDQVRNLRITNGNLLIEAVFRVEPGATGGLLAGKMDQTGYALDLDDAARLRLRLASGAATATCVINLAVNDGAWHHVVAEVNRAAGRMTIYLDGHEAKVATSGQVPATSESLDTTADFVVGTGLHGALDFLRVCRGTLADAETTIEALMAWQFNGPALRDMTGRLPVGVRDAGAIEYTGSNGQQDIVYTPKGGAAPAAGVNEDDGMRTGADRLVTATPWGVISVPKSARRGAPIDVQIACETQAIPDGVHELHCHFQSKVGGGRKVVAKAKPQRAAGFETGPWTFSVTVPADMAGSEVIVVVFASKDGSWKAKEWGGEVAVPLE